MEPNLVAALAHAAGLDRAWTEFPDDVTTAVEQARAFESALPIIEDPAAEPWPPMRVETGR